MNVIQEAEVASLAALVGAFTGFRLGIVAERRNQRRKSQLEFVPFIKRLISDIERTNPSVTWWNIIDSRIIERHQGQSSA
jgi:ABC-type phosphate/phosphonate transport system permease subunit